MAIDTVEVGEDLSDCPRCGRGGGFHVALRRRGRTLVIDLVCPKCGYRFRAGEWLIATGEPRPFDPKIDAGP